MGISMDGSFDFGNYRCQHENENGECTNEYEGYGCIKDRCSIFGTEMVRLDGEKKLCSYRQEDYCTRFRRFHCPGVEHCHTLNL
jgi:hypothetical protein